MIACDFKETFPMNINVVRAIIRFFYYLNDKKHPFE